jgi:hypothetical protein
MNERIKQLAEQCGFRSNPDIYDRNQSFDIPKFADSLVWECMKICEDVMKKDNSAFACWSAIKGTFRS